MISEKYFKENSKYKIVDNKYIFHELKYADMEDSLDILKGKFPKTIMFFKQKSFIRNIFSFFDSRRQRISRFGRSDSSDTAQTALRQWSVTVVSNHIPNAPPLAARHPSNHDGPRELLCWM